MCVCVCMYVCVCLQALALMSNVHSAVSPQHSWELFHTFRTHYLSCLTFLRRIASLWNKQSPTIVAGFAVNRDVSVQRLQPQPVGTFLCRLSCSRAGGGMALAVRVGPEHPHAGADQVLHVLITAADIQHKDVQTLLRDYTGTKYVLDVYTGKRMDKRKVGAALMEAVCLSTRCMCAMVSARIPALVTCVAMSAFG